jgi:4-alpha-glucanotransferase
LWLRPTEKVEFQNVIMRSEPASKKVSGILVPLFALRGARDFGVGDTEAMRDLIDWSASHNIGLIQLLPLNETGSDHSPYNAISSVALEPLTIALNAGDVPGLTESDIAEEQRHFGWPFRRGNRVAYEVVKPFKRAVLRRAFTRFKTDAQDEATTAEFEGWIARESEWLTAYVRFRAIMELSQGDERWSLWPMEFQTLKGFDRYFEGLAQEEKFGWMAEWEFLSWVQWVAHCQWARVRAYADGKGVSLMGDIPFGVNYYSADVFECPDRFDLTWSGGAPPEPAFQDDVFVKRWGQNWGVPLYDDAFQESEDFAWWRRRVRKNREIFHSFRMDHILGIYRIYGFPWRPEMNFRFASASDEAVQSECSGRLPRFHPRPDDTDSEKQLNREHGERFLRMLLEESGKGGLVGEDLGTVPDYVRPSLLSHGVPGFRIPYWELEWDTRLTPADAYDECAVATYATHDHDPLRVMWDRWMATIAKGESGLHADAEARDRAWWEVRRLANWAGFEVPCIKPFEDVHLLLVRALLRLPCRVVIFMVTDLFGTAQRFNVPGAVADSNWSARIETPVSEWDRNPSLKAFLSEVHHDLARVHARSSGR